MTDYDAAARLWTSREASAKRMPEDELLKQIEEFIGGHKTCALATASADGSLVRNTPVEYMYRDGMFWIFSEGGLKFTALKENGNVCLAIYNDDPSFDCLGGLQVTGMAEVVEPFSPEYIEAAEVRGLSADKLKGLSFVMNLIKVTPTRMDFLLSALKDQGYDSRQWFEFAEQDPLR